ECPMPWAPWVRYRGHYEGPTTIVAGDGTVLAERPAAAGEGVVVADVAFGAVEPSLPTPDGFWLHERGPLPTFAWHYQRIHGRRAYRRRRRRRRTPACPCRCSPRSASPRSRSARSPAGSCSSRPSGPSGCVAGASSRPAASARPTSTG